MEESNHNLNQTNVSDMNESNHQGMLSKLLIWVKKLTALQIITLALTISGTIFAAFQLYFIVFPPENQVDKKIEKLLDLALSQVKVSNESSKNIISEVVLSDSLENTTEVKRIREFQEDCIAVGKAEMRLLYNLSESDLSKCDINLLVLFLQQVHQYSMMSEDLFDTFWVFRENHKDAAIMSIGVLQSIYEGQKNFSKLQEDVLSDLQVLVVKSKSMSKEETQNEAKKIIEHMILDERFKSNLDALHNFRNEIMLACNQILMSIKKKNRPTPSLI